MCTNLYNTKRALIRHYSAVHKKIPSRDMIQAKGDKGMFQIVYFFCLNTEYNYIIFFAVYIYDKTNMDYLNVEESKGRFSIFKFLVHTSLSSLRK